MHLKPLVVKDPTFQMEAFRLLVPADWKAGGQIHWRLHPQYPAAASVTAHNPAGAEAVFFYPMVPFVEGVRHLPEGGNYLGNEVRRHPGVPAGYLTHFLLPRFRPGLRNYRVVASQEMPDWAKASAALNDARALGIRSAAQAARVRIAYREGGREVHEEFYILMPSLYMVGLHWWGTEWASSVRAEPAKLEEAARVHLAMMNSLQINPRWYNRERQVAAMLEQDCYREQARVMALSSYLARTQDQIRETINASYWKRQAAMDRVHANFNRYIRGVDVYTSPNSRRAVELPAGYKSAWVNGLGEYLLSNDSDYNPNRHLGGTWHRLTPAR